MRRFEPSAAELAAFAGEYYSDELGVSYVVAVKDSGLVLRRPKYGELALSPAFQDAFTAASTGTLRFSRTGRKVDSFFVTGGRVRGVAFRRGDPRRPRP